MSKNPVPFRVVTDNAFGRDPGGGTSRQAPTLRAATVDRLRARGIDEIICYAFAKTGLLVTKENWSLLPKGQQDEWIEAIEEAKSIDEADKAEADKTKSEPEPEVEKPT